MTSYWQWWARPCYFNYVINLKSIVAMMTRIGTTEVVLGIIGILILAECCRRVVGIPILCVATAFVLYAYLPMFAGKTVQSIVYNLFYTTNGVIGTPISVCCTYIVLFIIFGASWRPPASPTSSLKGQTPSQAPPPAVPPR